MNEHRIYGIKTGRDAIFINKPMTVEDAIPVYVFYPMITEFFNIGSNNKDIYANVTKHTETIKDF